MRHHIAIAFILFCAACTPINNSIDKAQDSVTKGAHRTSDRVYDWFQYKPEEKRPQPAQTRYCYKTASDVMCYDQPLSGPNQPPLLGVQGDGASRSDVGYTPVEPAPAPSVSAAPAGPFYVGESPHAGSSASGVSAGSPSTSQPSDAPGAPKSLLPRY